MIDNIFEIVSDIHRKFPNEIINLPSKGTQDSVGYDFYSNESKIIEPNSEHLFWSDIKVKLPNDMFLMIVVRSSIGIEYNLMLANTVGIIDPCYYQNISNDGNIGICLYNYGNTPAGINKGARIAQGIVIPFVVSNDVNKLNTRIGGIGSTGR